MDNNEEKVSIISIDKIDNFKNHPFRVIDDIELYKLADSIRDNNVTNPILVRPKENGRYEIISGHRRKRASELIGLNTIPCIIRDLTDDEATILMVDSNLQREKILPSEKAFAYKMKMDAIKHQGERNDITSCQVGTKLRSDESLASELNVSARQVQRYIRLTNLIKPLLDMVDNKELKISPSIAFNPAVYLSYLRREEQYFLLDSINYNEATPSLEQAKRMKELSQIMELDEDTINDIMMEFKPNQVERIKLDAEKVRGLIPRGVNNDSVEEYIVKALSYYKKYLNKKRELER